MTSTTSTSAGTLDLTVCDFETLEAPINWTHWGSGFAAGVAIGIALT